MTQRYTEIDAAIQFIQQHIYEPISLSQLASHVAYSPYHFARLFKERMGLSPLYYMSSLRLQKAKDLLLQTRLSIRDIGLEIGQQSLGTFTTRFTERVGMTPSEFRNYTLHADHHLRSLRSLNESRPSLAPPRQPAIYGTVRAEMPFEGVTLIGLFPKPIPEGIPLYGTLLTSLGPFSFTDVKPGVYYLMGTSVGWGMQAVDFLLPHTTLRTCCREPLIVGPGFSVPRLEITLREPSPDDPPILISLPLLMNNFLKRTSQSAIEKK